MNITFSQPAKGQPLPNPPLACGKGRGQKHVVPSHARQKLYRQCPKRTWGCALPTSTSQLQRRRLRTQESTLRRRVITAIPLQQGPLLGCLHPLAGLQLTVRRMHFHLQ